MDIPPLIYTVDEINAIGNALAGSPDNKAIILAGLLSNPSVQVIVPPARPRY